MNSLSTSSPSNVIDRLFAEGLYPRKFAFNEEVANVFDDMVTRSIPFYSEVSSQVLAWAQLHLSKESKIYDVGCSTGTIFQLLSQYINLPLQMIGIDTSQAMINKAKDKLSNINKNDQLTWLCQNALEVNYCKANMIVCNYTLQFIPLENRRTLIHKFYEGLKPGGLLFLSEKICTKDPLVQQTMTTIYEAYKRSRGYSQTEIERKKEALEQVLIPVTLEEQLGWLKEAGFRTIEITSKWYCFVSIVAIK